MDGVLECDFTVQGERDVITRVIWAPDHIAVGSPLVLIGHGGGAQSRSPQYYALWADAKRMTDNGISDWKRVLTAFLATGMFAPSRVGWSGMSMGSLIGVPYVPRSPG